MSSSTERLAYWYLRLNGFLLWENFVIHPDAGHHQRTEADLVGIRFKHRADRIGDRGLDDDRRVASSQSACSIVIAEVTTRRCKLNDKWVKPEYGNVQRLLRAMGCVPEPQIDEISEQLYGCGRFSSENISCQFVSIGTKASESMTPQDVVQITFSQIIKFIYGRFRPFLDEKSSTNWEVDGRKLFKFAKHFDSEDDFEKVVKLCFGVPLGQDQLH